MKKKYYVNTQPQANGDHEVHNETCSYLPGAASRLYLGEFYSCKDAVTEAKKTYPKSDGCYYCSRECHKS